MADVPALVTRLEAAVIRLEALETRLMGGSIAKAGASEPQIANRELESAGSSSVAAFEELIATAVAKVVQAAEQIGGQVLDATRLLQRAFEEEARIIRAISQCKKPDMENLQTLIQPLAMLLMQANSLTDGKRTEFFFHLKVVAESLQALSWVVYTKDSGMSKPATQVEESWHTAEFYNNKLLTEYRSKDAKQVEWATSMKALYLPTLRDYVKKFHGLAPAWNENGIDVKQHLEAESTVAPSTPKGKAPAPPPPPPVARPPPPPPPPVGGPPGTAGPSKPSMSAVFRDISKGEAVTSGLRKVTDDMKTKNRSDRSGVVQALDKSGRLEKLEKPGVKPPKFELQMDRKWVVENQVDNKGIVISDCSPKQTVYVFGCKGSLIQVRGKVNSIMFDKCVKSALVFKDVVGACEIVNCTSVEVQCEGAAPTIAVDNTNGCQLYLSKESLKAGITTAKSSEINVLVPGATPDADLVEHALPEQFISVFENGRFVTSPVAHSGG